MNSYWGVISILAWFKSRKYIIYIAYGIILLMSILIIEIHIDNKRDKLFFDLRGKVQSSFGDINQSIDALDFKKHRRFRI